jgi:hypothetical protein
VAYTYTAYNAAPAGLSDDRGAEERWYGILRDEPLIGGLELSFDGSSLHPDGVGRLGELLAPGWRNIVSTIACTLGALARDASYGLASTDEAGRQAALSDVRTMYEQVRELQELLGDDAIVAVELNSGPCTLGGQSSAYRYADSLAEVAGWGWGGTAIAAEHADAVAAGRPPAKGFLALADETRAVDEASSRSGVELVQSINWGRSAIETRSIDGVTGHITELAGRGRLAGLIFSGAGASVRSPEWQDAHLASAELEEGSIMTSAAMAAALRAAGEGLRFVGVKVGAAAGATTIEERLALGLGTLHQLDGVVAASRLP